MTDEERAFSMVRRWEHGDEAHRQWLRDTVVPDLVIAMSEIRRMTREADALKAFEFLMTKHLPNMGATLAEEILGIAP
jgi:hypothetical protein